MNPIAKPGTPAQPPVPTSAQVTQVLDEDHGQLEELTARLSSVRERDALTEVLEDLARSLREHYTHEEHAKGFYGILTAKGPEYRDQTAQLVAEHRELMLDLRHLLALSQERPAPTSELARAAADLSARLHDHEAREMKLVQALA
jgi:malate synthase